MNARQSEYRYRSGGGGPGQSRVRFPKLQGPGPYRNLSINKSQPGISTRAGGLSSEILPDEGDAERCKPSEKA